MPIIRTLLLGAMLMPVPALAADGALDPGFANGDGVFFPNYAYLSASVGDHSARSVAIDTDERLLVVGDFQRDAALDNRDCGLLRVLPDANQYDVAFLPPTGYGHLAFDRGGSNTDLCFDVVPRADQGIVVVGSATVDATERREGVVFQTLADGRLDPDFFGDGIFETAIDGPSQLIASDAELRHILRDETGFVVSGSAQLPTPGGGHISRGIALRFKTDGTLDTEFGEDGPVVFLGGDASGVVDIRGIARASDGSLWFAGDLSGSGIGNGGRVFRMRPDRSMDPDAGGSSGLDVPQCAYITAIEIDSAERVLLGCNPGDAISLAGVLRLAPDGTTWLPDISFGNAGFAPIRVRPEDTPGVGPQLASASAIGVQPDGRIVIAATYVTERLNRNPSDAVVARLRQDGTLDDAFGNAGIARFGFGGGIDLTRDTATAMALDSNARPVFVGASYSSASQSKSFFAARLQQLPDALFSNSFEPF